MANETTEQHEQHQQQHEAAWAVSERAFDLRKEIDHYFNVLGRIVDPALPARLFETSVPKNAVTPLVHAFFNVGKEGVAAIGPAAMIKCVEKAPALLFAKTDALPAFMLDSPMLGYHCLVACSASFEHLSSSLRHNHLLALFAVLRDASNVAHVPIGVLRSPAFHVRAIRLAAVGHDTTVSARPCPDTTALSLWELLPTPYQEERTVAMLMADSGLLYLKHHFPPSLQTDAEFLERAIRSFANRDLNRNVYRRLKFYSVFVTLDAFAKHDDETATPELAAKLVREHPGLYCALPASTRRAERVADALFATRPSCQVTAREVLNALAVVPRAVWERAAAGDATGDGCFDHYKRALSCTASSETFFVATRVPLYSTGQQTTLPHAETSFALESGLPCSWLQNDRVLRHLLFKRGCVGLPHLLRKCVKHRDKPALVDPPFGEHESCTLSLAQTEQLSSVEWRIFEVLLERPDELFHAMRNDFHAITHELETVRGIARWFGSASTHGRGDALYESLAKHMSPCVAPTFAFWGEMDADSRARRLADTAPGGFCDRVLGTAPCLFYTEEVARQALAKNSYLARTALACELRYTKAIDLEKHYDLSVLLLDDEFVDFCFKHAATAETAVAWMLKQPASSTSGALVRDPLFLKTRIVANESLPDKVRKNLYALLPVECLTRDAIYHATKRWGTSGDEHEAGLADATETRLLRIAAREHSVDAQLSGAELCDKQSDLYWLLKFERAVYERFKPSDNWKCQRPTLVHAEYNPSQEVWTPFAELKNDLHDDDPDANNGLAEARAVLSRWTDALAEITRIETVQDAATKKNGLKVHEFFQLPGHGLRCVFREHTDVERNERGEALRTTRCWKMTPVGTNWEIALPPELLDDMPRIDSLHGLLTCSSAPFAAAKTHNPVYKRIRAQKSLAMADVDQGPALRFVVTKVGSTALSTSLAESLRELGEFLAQRRDHPVGTFLHRVAVHKYAAESVKLCKQAVASMEVPDVFTLVMRKKNAAGLIFERDSGEVAKVADRIARFVETGPLAVIQTVDLTGATVADAIKEVEKQARNARNPLIYAKERLLPDAKRRRVEDATSAAGPSGPSAPLAMVESSDDDE